MPPTLDGVDDVNDKNMSNALKDKVKGMRKNEDPSVRESWFVLRQ